MTEKVKVPQEIADAIERLRKKPKSDFEIIILVNRPDRESGYTEIESIKDWIRKAGYDVDLLLEVLVNGYEIAPEYKIGDWVANLDGSNIYPKGDVKVVEVGLVDEFYVRPANDVAWGFPFSLLRHATPEEIKTEVERQLWESIGRKVGEFRDGDTIELQGELGFRIYFDKQIKIAEDQYEKGNITGFHPSKSFISVAGDSND